MFPAAHPDIMGQLARERVAELRADAERHRRGRPRQCRSRYWWTSWTATAPSPTAEATRLTDR